MTEIDEETNNSNIYSNLNTVTHNKCSDKFVFCYIFHTKPYFFKETQCCHICFDLNEINSKQGRISLRFIVYWLIILT